MARNREHANTHNLSVVKCCGLYDHAACRSTPSHASQASSSPCGSNPRTWPYVHAVSAIFQPLSLPLSLPFQASQGITIAVWLEIENTTMRACCVCLGFDCKFIAPELQAAAPTGKSPCERRARPLLPLDESIEPAYRSANHSATSSTISNA